MSIGTSGSVTMENEMLSPSQSVANTTNTTTGDVFSGILVLAGRLTITGASGMSLMRTVKFRDTDDKPSVTWTSMT